ncbi:MAG: tRNA (adenosine(37)-N6)-threonylcarbamoyltransferase complex ATPase subunit type 1 TsaE [Treponema sp.]|nr:tRNA (adenosine(37)-N6)-threonylcarbamoyltransferase complex ATPase subunit type 1 TsaE [Treponema sp.]
MAFLPCKDCISCTPEETVLLGEKIGNILKPGDIVAVKGNLGAGKTVFAKGIAKSLGVREELTSPTYTIISEYKAAVMPFFHMDAYRLSGDDDFRLAGGEELLYGTGVCVVEWPERISLPSSAFYVHIEIMEDGKRLIHYRIPE